MTDTIETRDDMIPLVGAGGMAYAYLTPMSYLGDGADHVTALTTPGSLGNGSLFASIENGFVLTHRALIHAEVHAEIDKDVKIERSIAIQLDKGPSGGLMPRGRAMIVNGLGNASYSGLLEAGHKVYAIVESPADEITVLSGYISVTAVPV